MHTEEYEQIAHTGGKLSFSKDGSVTYSHCNHHGVTLIPINISIEWIITDEDGTNPRVQKTPIEIYLASDREEMFGRKCPRCNDYFRMSAPPKVITCPYCSLKEPSEIFMTEAQVDFIKAYTEALAEIQEGKAESIEIDIDELLSNIDNTYSAFAYTETRQQTNRVCCECKSKYDIFGIHGYCPHCGYRNSIQLFKEKLALLVDRVDNPRYEKHQRAERD